MEYIILSIPDIIGGLRKPQVWVGTYDRYFPTTNTYIITYSITSKHTNIIFTIPIFIFTIPIFIFIITFIFIFINSYNIIIIFTFYTIN